MHDINKKLDMGELHKIEVNNLIFAKYNRDYFEIAVVLEILSLDTLPVEINLNNNLIFIRDITKFIVANNHTNTVGWTPKY